MRVSLRSSLAGEFSHTLGYLWLLALTIFVGAEAAEAPQSPVTLEFLKRRAQYQESNVSSMQAFRGFQFADRVEQSGIRFQHRIVDDAGKNYKAAQYDHGNGLAAADVDGDGSVDLYFTTQLGRNQLWRNLGGGRFEDFTDRAGLALEDQISVGASFADYDKDGRPDLFVTTVRKGNHLFRNLGAGRFQDVTQDAGLNYTGHSSGAAFCDFDNDGQLDLLVANVGVYTSDQKGRGGYYVGLTDAFSGHLFPERTESSRLYRNLGNGRFEDVSQAMKLWDGSWSGDVVFADLNNDLYPDFYLPNMQGDDHYYENQQGAGFVDRTAALFPKTPWGATGAGFFDYNQDGLMDLFVTDMHSDMTQQQTDEAGGFRPSIEKKKSEAYCALQWTEEYLKGASNNIFGNAFYQNRGKGVFVEVSDALGLESYWPWGFSVGDLNADGFEDLVITAGMGYPFRYAVNSVLLNEAGKRFYDVEFLVGVEPRRGGRLGKEWFTLDCSGADQTNALCAGKSGIVSVPGSLTSRSSVVLDLDDDGDLDLVTNEFNDQPQVLLSDLSDRRPVRFLKVKLVGGTSNRDGLGARVRVNSGGRVWGQYHHGKSGYLGQSSWPLYFGLGTAEAVESVEVWWPSGRRQIMEKPPVNTLLTLVEPGPGAP